MIDILYHVWRECGAKKCQKENNRPERELVSEVTAKTLSDYPPTKSTTVTPTFSVVEGPGHSGVRQAPAMNTDSTKEAHTDKSVKSIWMIMSQ